MANSLELFNKRFIKPYSALRSSWPCCLCLLPFNIITKETIFYSLAIPSTGNIMSYFPQELKSGNKDCQVALLSSQISDKRVIFLATWYSSLFPVIRIIGKLAHWLTHIYES